MENSSKRNPELWYKIINCRNSVLFIGFSFTIISLQFFLHGKPQNFSLAIYSTCASRLNNLVSFLEGFFFSLFEKNPNKTKTVRTLDSLNALIIEIWRGKTDAQEVPLQHEEELFHCDQECSYIFGSGFLFFSFFFKMSWVVYSSNDITIIYGDIGLLFVFLSCSWDFGKNIRWQRGRGK